MLISVIIPMRNEEKFVGKCLESFLCQEMFNENLEILCIDGMSTDGTRDIVRKYVRSNDRICLMENSRKFAAAGMNLGIVQSHGDFIIIASCHAEYYPDYIVKCLEVIQRTGADLVGGYIKTLAGSDTPVARAIAAATSYRFGVGNAAFRLSGAEKEVDTVAFGMYRRSAFEKAGLFDERLIRNQDIELNSRLRKAGGRIIISPEIKVAYYNRGTFRGLWKQSFGTGYWNPYTIWLTGGGLSLRHFVPMLFVLGLIGLAAGAIFFQPAKWLLLSYILLYLSAACFFAVCRILVLWSFIVLHLAYGLGSLWAVITLPFKFLQLKKFLDETRN